MKDKHLKLVSGVLNIASQFIFIFIKMVVYWFSISSEFQWSTVAAAHWKYLYFPVIDHTVLFIDTYMRFSRFYFILQQ